MNIVETAKAAAQSAIQTAMGKAIRLAPESWLPGGAPDPLIDNRGSLIGAPISRIDGPIKVRGEAAFAGEVVMENMAYAALAFSTIGKGRIATLDTRAAETAPGVVLSMTYRNAPRMQPMPMMMGPSESNARAGGGDNLAIMQDDQVHWNGQPVALVLAETQEQADHAAALIRVTYEARPAVTTFDQAKANGTVAGLMMGHALKKEIGDAEAMLVTAATSVDEIFRTPFQNHNAIEPHAATITWHGDELLVHDASQGVTHAAASLALVFGIEEKMVRVLSPYVGGSFGGKMLWQHQVLGAAASRLAGRPVRISLSREGVYRVVGGRAMTEQRVAIGANANGRFSAIIHTGTSSTTERNQLSEPFMHATMSAYAADSFSLDDRLAFLDTVANSQMRAPGGAVGTFALECAVDELAAKLGIDPIDLRLRNQPDRDPVAGTPFSSRHAVEVWREGAERFGWSGREATPGAVRQGEWLVGIGCAASSHPYIRMPGGAARITITGDGHARVEIAAHEMGMGTATAQTQIVAERLGLAFDQVSFGYGDSTLPGLVLAAGSQQTASIGASVIAAHRKLVAELLTLAGNASPLAGLRADEVGGWDGGLAKLDDPDRHERFAAILARTDRDTVSVEGSAPMPFEMMHWSMHSQGAMFCEVRVNAVTGEIRVSRFLGFFDCGRVINAKTAASQLRGGIVMGLGLALMEEALLDGRNGRIMNPSLAEYHVPVHMDVPKIDVGWLDLPDPRSPMGARGIGELGITGTAAAVANAVFNATGKRMRNLPITLDKLL